MALLTLSACGSVAIKEETFYTDAGDQGAVVSHFFSTDSSVMGRAAWDSIREGMTCMSPDAIGDIKKEIEQLCSKVDCTKVVPAFAAQSVSPGDMQAFKESVFALKQFLARLDEKVHAVTSQP